MARKKDNKKNVAKTPKRGSAGKQRSRNSKQKQVTASDKIVNYLNEALAVENAAIPRLQQRIKETTLKEAKEKLRHHLEETREQQTRLQGLIENLGGRATKEKVRLDAFDTLPKSLKRAMQKSMTDAEKQVKAAKEDAIIENAEVVMYDTLSQLAQVMNIGQAVPALTQNLNEEREMADWLRANTPAMITQLYPSIQSSIVVETAGEEQAHEGGLETTPEAKATTAEA